MKYTLFLLMPLLLWGQDLLSLINAAQNTNHLLKASEWTVEARAKALASQKSASYPTVDIGTAYSSVNQPNISEPGNTLNLYATAGVDLFDGFRNSALIAQKENEHTASKYDLAYNRQSLTLEIINDFFTILSQQGALKALKEKARQLQANLDRVKKFKAAELATQDEIDKLQSAYDANRYHVHSLQHTIEELKSYLSLKTGVMITTLETTRIISPEVLTYTESDHLKSLKAQATSLEASAKAANAVYYPNVRLEDTYNYYDYARDGGIARVEKQNRVLLAARMRIYDNASVQKQKQSILLQKNALLEQINYQEKQEKIRFNLALDTIKTAKANVKSTQSAYTAAKSTYQSIQAKFNAGIVDNITYLDALTQKTDTDALYQKSLHDLEIAKANYYFHAGKNIKDFIK